MRAFLREHHGVISTTELHALGFKPAAIARLVADQELERLTYSVYRSCSAPITPESTLRRDLLRSGPHAALARESAGYALGYLQFLPARTQLLVPGTSGFRLDDDRERHCGTGLTAADFITLPGLRSTSPRRTVLDLAAAAAEESNDVGLPAFRRAIRGAAIDDPGLVDGLRGELDRAPFPGSRVLAAELRGGIERTLVVRSNVEDRFVALCERYGLPIPVTNAVVHGWELDAYWEEENAFVEIDTYKTHGDEVSFERDHEKIARLIALGMRGFGVTDRRIDFASAAVAADVRGLLQLG